MLRKYQEEIERLKDLLELRQSTPFLMKTVGSPHDDLNQSHLDLKRDQLIREYEAEMQKLKNLHESEKSEKEGIVRQIEIIKEEYRRNIEKLNEQMRRKEEIKPSVSTHEILERIAVLKASMIGGEKANDKELSERRRRKKLAAERRLRWAGGR